MELTVKFLALAKDLTGVDECMIDLTEPEITVERLLEQIFSAFPRLREIRKHFILALNLEYLNLEDVSQVLHLKAGDELAVLPPLSNPECGGTAIFIGTSRSTSRQSDKSVIALDYQAYIPMAVLQLKKICINLRKQNAPSIIGNIVLAHRVGYVPIGKPGLFVGVSAPHRKEAIESMDWAIFQIKAKVPVWKQEVYEDYTRAWTVNCECYWLPSHPQSQALNSKGQPEDSNPCHFQHAH